MAQSISKLLLVAMLASAAAAPVFSTDGVHPLTLAECVKIAEAHQPDLAVSQAMVRVAEARLRAAHAVFLPRVDLGASYIRQSYNFAAQPGTTPRQVQLFSSPERFTSAPYYFAGLNASQTVYDFGRSRATVSRGEFDLAASRQNLRRQRNLVFLNVRSAYFGVLAAEELVRIRQEAVGNQGKHLDQVRAFYEVGRRPKIDVTRQEVALANTEVDLRQAREDLDVAKAALATSMGLSIEQAPEPVNVLRQEQQYASLGQLLAEAERNRPDLESLRDQLAATQADMIAARSNFRPTIGLSSFFDYRNLKFPLIYNWSLGALLAQNLFAGGADRALIAQVAAQQDATRAELTSLLQRVRQEVFTAQADLQVAHDKIGLAIKTEGEARENMALAEGRYQAAYGNIIELTDAQLVDVSSKAQEVQARYDYQVAAARLDAALGREVK